MREWILENTNVTKQEYDTLLNINTVAMQGQSKKYSIDELSNHPMVNIALFTTEKNSPIKRKKFKITRKKDSNKKNYYIYKQIEFYILSEFLSSLKYTLQDTKRHHQCFHLNSKICLMINKKSYLITAMCNSPYHKTLKKYIHTFTLIITKDNQEYIIDGTANIIMKKDTYFNIFNPQIISCIEKEKLANDSKILEPFEEKELIYKAEYFCFPSKIMNSIKKLTRTKN